SFGAKRRTPCLPAQPAASRGVSTTDAGLPACLRRFLKPRQPPDRARLALLQNQLRQHLPDSRPVLEPVPRAAAHEPHIFHRRMPVDDEVTVRSLLVLANASLHQRRVLQGREAKANIFTNVSYSFLTDHALTVCGIESLPTRVVRNLEPTPAAARNAVTKASPVIGPYRQMPLAEAIIPRRRAEEENILLGSLHKIAHGLWEQLAQPRPAGKQVAVGPEPGAI